MRRGSFEPIHNSCPLRKQGLRYDDLDNGHCSHCNERVVNLSHLTEPRARALVESGGAKCVAIERDRAGRPLFRVSAVASLFSMLGLVDAHAADIDVRTGIEVAETREPRIDFGLGPRRGGSLLPDASCHPNRWPHGPGGPAWISVRRGLSQVWNRIVLECHDGKRLLLRERREFPQPGESLQLTALPTDTECELELRGGAPKTKIAVRTPSENPAE